MVGMGGDGVESVENIRRDDDRSVSLHCFISRRLFLGVAIAFCYFFKCSAATLKPWW